MHALANSDYPATWPLYNNIPTWPDWSDAYDEVNKQSIYLELDDRFSDRDIDHTQGYPIGIKTQIVVSASNSEVLEDAIVYQLKLKIQFSKFSFFSFLFQKYIFLIFVRDFFILKKKYKSKHFPGIQKSYLENRAVSLKIPKTADPQNLQLLPGSGTSSVDSVLSNSVMSLLFWFRISKHLLYYCQHCAPQFNYSAEPC